MPLKNVTSPISRLSTRRSGEYLYISSLTSLNHRVGPIIKELEISVVLVFDPILVGAGHLIQRWISVYVFST